MTGNGIEKHCFIVLNVKLHVKLRFKTFYWLLELLYTASAMNTTNKPAYFARNFAYPSNKRVIYTPELNL